MFGDVLWEYTENFLKQQGLLKPIEFHVPTRSEISASALKNNKNESIDAGTQTDDHQAKRKSVLRDTSSVSIPSEDYLSQDRETFTPILQSMSVGLEASWESDVEDIYSEDSLVYKGGDDNITDSEVPLRYLRDDGQATPIHGIARPAPITEGYVPKLKDQEQEWYRRTRIECTKGWLDSILESSAPINRKHTGKASSPRRGDLGDNHKAKRRRVNSWPRWESIEPNSSDELFEGLETDTSHDYISGNENGDVCGHDSDAIMTYASQRPQVRNAPTSSVEAMKIFAQYSNDAEVASIVATAGSKESEFDFVLYQERRQNGIEGRESFFRRERDEVLKSVDDLLQRWTYIDAPHAGQADKPANLALQQGEELN